jgi:uncharacterized repeat protein (TIGR01451 family)
MRLRGRTHPVAEAQPRQLHAPAVASMFLRRYPRRRRRHRDRPGARAETRRGDGHGGGHCSRPRSGDRGRPLHRGRSNPCGAAHDHEAGKPTHVQSGSTVSFTIRVTNQSGAAVHHVSVCDRLPTGLTRISGGTVHGTRVCWTVSSLRSRASRRFVLRARAVAPHTHVVTNLASVTAHGVATRSARATVVIINPVPSFTG